MSDPLLAAVGNSGGVAVIEHSGKKFTVHPMTDRLRSQYLSWVHSYVISELEKQRRYYTPKAYREVRSDLAMEIASGQFGFGSARYQAIAETPNGIVAFIKVVLQDESLTDDQLLDFLDHKSDEYNAEFRRVNGITDDEKDENEDQENPDPKATTPPKST